MSEMPTDIMPYPGDPRYGVTPKGRVFRLVRMHNWLPGEAKQHPGKRGYLVVCVNARLVPVHRLVAETFIPNPEGKREVAHNNGRRHDNWVENLRWATRKENNSDMEGHGTLMFGDAHVARKLCEADVREIKDILSRTRRPRHVDIATRYGVTRECIGRIAQGRTWRRVEAY